MEFCGQDAVKLLRERSVDEVFAISEAIERQIEENRATLRLIVQSDYSDVLGIHHLLENINTAAERICEHVNAIQEHSLNDYSNQIENLQQKFNSKCSLSNDANSVLLLPEKIWQSLDEDNFIQAVQLLKFAQQLAENNDNDVIKYSAQKIGYFKKKIRSDLELKLKHDHISEQNLVNYLLSYLIIWDEEREQSRQLVTDLMELRNASILDLFSSGRFREDISLIFTNIINTIQLVYYAFNKFETEPNFEPEVYLTKDDHPIQVPIPQKIDLEFKDSDLVCFEKYLKLLETEINANFSLHLNSVIEMKDLHAMYRQYQKISRPQNWSRICTFFGLEANFCIWDNFIKTLMISRLKTVIRDRIVNSFASLRKRILENKGSGDCAGDLTDYLWSDGADVSVHTVKMKIKGYSLLVIELCDMIDGEIKYLLWELQSYVDFNENYEKEELHEYLKNMFVEFVKDFSSEWTEVIDLETIQICCRFFEAILSLCPNLRKCFQRFETDWNELSEFLLKSNDDLWLLWIKIVLDKLDVVVRSYFHEIGSKNCYFMNSKKIEIEEEVNSETFKSEIEIPQQSSFQIQQILSEACHQFGSVLPHTVPVSVHVQFIGDFLRLILNQYSDLARKQSNFNQKLAVQYYFDVKYLTNFCFVNEDLLDLCRSICDEFQLRIDPFDFKVFYPFLKQNCRNCVAQSKLLYGSLLRNHDQFTAYDNSSGSSDESGSSISLRKRKSVHFFTLLPTIEDCNDSKI